MYDHEIHQSLSSNTGHGGYITIFPGGTWAALLRNPDPSHNSCGRILPSHQLAWPEVLPAQLETLDLG